MPGAMPRLSRNCSKRVRPASALRRMSMLHHSPTRSSERAIGHDMSPKLLRRMVALQVTTMIIVMTAAAFVNQAGDAPCAYGYGVIARPSPSSLFDRLTGVARASTAHAGTIAGPETRVAGTGVASSGLAWNEPRNRGTGMLMPEAQQEVAEAQYDLDDNEADNVPFEQHAALRLHHVEDRADSLVDERELALHAAAALDELVLVLEARIEALELGVVPQHIGLLLHLDAPDHALLRQQHAADLPQQAGRLRAGAAGALQPVGERLDLVEGFGDAALVMRQDQALRQHIRDDLQPLRRRLAQRDAAGRIDLVLAAGLDQNLHLVGLRRRRGIDD